MTGAERDSKARKLGAEALALDLLAFVEEISDFSGNTDLQIRARVLAARVDLEIKKAAKKLYDEAFCGEHRTPLSTCGCPRVPTLLVLLALLCSSCFVEASTMKACQQACAPNAVASVTFSECRCVTSSPVDAGVKK
jgi:hypothetical protein